MGGMNITRGQVWCQSCRVITLHIYGKSWMGKLWKECQDCGKTSKLDM